VELFLQLSEQSVVVGLIGFDLSAREFKVLGPSTAGGTAGQEHITGKVGAGYDGTNDGDHD
jgi:hypothetical protein